MKPETINWCAEMFVKSGALKLDEVSCRPISEDCDSISSDDERMIAGNLRRLARLREAIQRFADAEEANGRHLYLE